MGDRVLRDLTDNRLFRLQDLLDPSVPALFNIVSVEVHIAAVKHRIFRCADVDERRFHAGQHVLNLAQVDVSVDLRHVIGGSRDEVLNQIAALKYGDLRGLGTNANCHQVATHWATIALAAATTIECLLIKIWSAATENRLDRTVGAAATRAATLTALTRLRLTAGLRLGLAGVLTATTIARAIAATIAIASASAASTATCTGSGLALTGFAFGRLGLLRLRRGGTNIADLGSLPGGLVGRGRARGPVLR